MPSMLSRLPFLCAAVALLVVSPVAAGAPGVSARPEQVRVLVVKATSGPQPYTDADIDSVMQGVEHFYATASFGKVSMSYVQTPWLDIEPEPFSCPQAAQQLPGLAAQAGWNPADYGRVVYLFIPSQGGCGGAFEDPTGEYLPAVFPVGAIIHELGHSFDMGHAGLLTCWYQQRKRLCSGDQYGDTADVMGSGGSNALAYVGDFGGLQKARAGWLTPTYITKPGTYRLAPVEVASALPQALVIRGSAYEYWIDTREPVGNDAHLGGPAVSGFAVHRIAEDPFAPGADPLMPDYLVPNAHSSSYYTAPGKTFTLPGVFALTALSRSHAGVMTVRYRKLGH
jgi:hypothetical protein